MTGYILKWRKLFPQLRGEDIVKFEYDLNKSRQNQLKHGLSFEEAQVLWQGFNRIEISAKSVDEPRFMIISKFQEKHWSAIITYQSELSL